MHPGRLQISCRLSKQIEIISIMMMIAFPQVLEFMNHLHFEGKSFWLHTCFDYASPLPRFCISDRGHSAVPQQQTQVTRSFILTALLHKCVHDLLTFRP
jgi:hypothetical protein